MEEKKVEHIRSVYNNPVSKKSKRHIKPMIMAVLSAILIGSILGFFMLHMFTNVDEKLNGNELEVSTKHLNQTKDKRKQTSLVAQEEMSAYVLQGGVFSELSNAEQWAEMFRKVQLPTVIFEENQQYFLFVGIAYTEKQAQEIASAIKQQSDDIYVKQWYTSKGELDLTAEEGHWMEDFRKQWEDTLQSVHMDGEILTDGWGDLMNSSPSSSQTIVPLLDKINEFYQKGLEQLNKEEWQHILLSTWKLYEELLS